MEIKCLSLKTLQRGGELGDVCLILTSLSKLQSKTFSHGFNATLASRIHQALELQTDPLKAGAKLHLPRVEKTEADTWIYVLPEDLSAFNLLTSAGGWVKQITSATQKASLVFVDAKTEEKLADVLGAALSVRVFQMPLYGKKLKEAKKFKLAHVFIYATGKIEKAFNTGYATGDATNIVRELATLPPNILNTQTYEKYIRDFAQEYKLQVKFYSKKELKKMGAEAFLAVDRGKPDSNAGIYELTYAPSKAKNKNFISLVGKGICFDTGGYNIKSGAGMAGMKGDMAGSSLALASLIMARKLNWPLKMKAYLAVAENHISPSAYRPDEVVIAMNGIAIEVIDTDAEGRMVLSDTLTLASRAKPDLLIDFATLTGAATVAIGTSYAAGFTNREELHAPIVKAGRACGERVWTFPIDKDFAKPLESSVADIAQCAKGRSPDHILAAYFLSQFVEKDVPWVHIDLAAADRSGGLAHVDSYFTGFGARWVAEFLKTKFKV